MTAELVSVIIPTYNRARLVEQAIESVQGQTWPHYEIIVVDDGSTDETPERLSDRSDIRYFRQERAGQAAARNRGLAEARGSFICTLDSDDLWGPRFLEECVGAIESLGVEFVFANWKVLDGRKQIHDYFARFHPWQGYRRTHLDGWRVISEDESRDVYLYECLSPSSSLLFRRSLLNGGWDAELKIGDDWALLIERVLRQPCRVGFTMRPLWLKRKGDDNIYDGRERWEVISLLHVHDFLNIANKSAHLMSKEEKASVDTHVAYYRVQLARKCLRAGDFRQAAHLLVQVGIRLAISLAIAPSAVFRRVTLLRNMDRRPPLTEPWEFSRDEVPVEV